MMLSDEVFITIFYSKKLQSVMHWAMQLFVLYELTFTTLNARQLLKSQTNYKSLKSQPRCPMTAGHIIVKLYSEDGSLDIVACLGNIDYN